MAVQQKMLSLAVAAVLIPFAMAANYTVGGTNGGWDQSTNLQSWASSQSFSVGDNLVFQYAPSHDVLEVRKADYDSCQTGNPLRSYNGGNTVVPLSSPGKRYFICGTLGHCAQGMKIEVDTLASSASPAASPAPAAASPAPEISPVSPIPGLEDSPATSPDIPSLESPANSPSSVGSSLQPSPSSARANTAIFQAASMIGISFVMTMLQL